MIRVLQVVGKMHYGGMETLIMNIYRHINRDKIQFDFLVHYDEPGEYDEEIRALGGNIYIMPKTVPQNYFIYKEALHEFFSEHQEYKIIHGHLQSTAFLYHKIAKETGKRCCITHSHTTDYDKNLKGFLGYRTSLLAQRYTDVFFGCSDEACRKFFPEALKQGKKYTVIKNGIESEKYVYSAELRSKMRRTLNLEDSIVIGHVGRFQPPKNHRFLLEVFSEILKKKSDCLLLLVGDGPLKNEIMEQARRMAVSERVIFTGVRGDVNELLQAMDVFVFPSLFEGLGITLIEAQASGMRCFASSTVPNAAKVTDLLDYIKLDKPAEYWAENILSALPYKRGNTRNDIINSGYDISETAKYLEHFYINAAGQGD